MLGQGGGAAPMTPIHQGLSERVFALLSEGTRHDPILDVEQVRAWLVERGVSECSQFLDFHSRFGGLEYWIPGTTVYLGLWERDVTGKPVAPSCWRDTQGRFHVSCGNLLISQINLSMREDGFIFEDEDLAYTSVAKCLEDHAALAWDARKNPRWHRRSIRVQSEQSLDELGRAGMEIMHEASDQDVVWWRGDGLLVRDVAMTPPEEKLRSVFVSAEDPRQIENVRALLREKIVVG
ncbi:MULTISPECIES: hypothetical protein [Corallococcus]|uniref:hypothetical protein n=1 Tax=Corallococcus TaxID=83461 RepID=UPI000F87AE6F|nr:MULTISPECIES: hypothetical protein [Corallococcus]NRD54299.1 hypothetical protein [Corallococcus exiguus]